MNPRIDKLHAYPFEKLRKLKASLEANSQLEHIALSIGEPRHAPPAFVLDALTQHLGDIARYPQTAGCQALRATIAQWAARRFSLPQGTLTAEHHILPVNGTREALFAIAQVVVNAQVPQAKVLMPNPFYQIYEGACLLAGATPHFIDCNKKSAYLPDFDAVETADWEACQLLYICTPGNPTGATLSLEQLKGLIALADAHDFIIASDECYSEIYFDSPPAGLLQACAQLGRKNYDRCIVFNSLSKRSNLPGLRSGFVAGDRAIIEKFLRYRTYHGCAMPGFSQAASIAAWQDEQHVEDNRQLYRDKFAAVGDILAGFPQFTRPEAGFFMWPEIAMDDELFCQQLYKQSNITVLPGTYLARPGHRGNPGSRHVRMAMVGSMDECVEAARRIKLFLERHLTTC